MISGSLCQKKNKKSVVTRLGIFMKLTDKSFVQALFLTGTTTSRFGNLTSFEHIPIIYIARCRRQFKVFSSRGPQIIIFITIFHCLSLLQMWERKPLMAWKIYHFFKIKWFCEYFVATENSLERFLHSMATSCPNFVLFFNHLIFR